MAILIDDELIPVAACLLIAFGIGSNDTGIDARLTRADHTTGTHRLAEAVVQLGLADDTIVVNVQGDEPLMPPTVVRQVAGALAERSDCAIATACHPLQDAAEFFSPHVVKVVMDTRGRALYFSRAPIPWSRDAFAVQRDRLPPDLPARRHIGLYAYRAEFLRRYPQLPPAPLEQHESLEQLRALAHGFGIVVVELPQALPPGVDTPEDLERVRALIATAS